jgi:aminoglycoside phosphotransferase (APT) family kinase protein
MTGDDGTMPGAPVDQPDYTVDRPQTSTRDYRVLRTQLQAWLQERLDGSQISELTVPASNGMSSETVLFDVDVPGEKETRRLVARIAPDPAADPVFQHYDMELQFRTMQMVAEHTGVPVPRVLWLETDAGPIGAPFFVMERIEGVVPPDVMPYTYGDNWFFDATLEQQMLLEHRAIEVLAALHQLGPDGPAGFLVPRGDDRSALRCHVEAQRGYYEWVAGDGTRSPLIELGFEWLDEHWPDREGDPVFSWGDARIGNMMFEDFSPVAVLDWEMASIGPREIDLGWMIYIHRFFQDLVEDLGMPGLPHVLRRSSVATYYEQLTGYAPRDLDFFTLYAALRHGIVMFRIAVARRPSARPPCLRIPTTRSSITSISGTWLRGPTGTT